jgi:hypothetical protein
MPPPVNRSFSIVLKRLGHQIQKPGREVVGEELEKDQQG